jgi:glucose/arabinose dehydrogenase
LPRACRRVDRAAKPGVEGLEIRVTPTTLPTGFTETAVTSGLNFPTAMDFSPDGRLFVLEQGGAVKLVRSDGTTWTALQLTVDSNGERGVLGIAFDPAFASNHYVYLYYTNTSSGASAWSGGVHNQVSRFTVNDTNPQQPMFTAEAPILDLNSLSADANHNSGAIHFGPDGKLYVDVGDNRQSFTLGGNTYRVSQTLGNMLGKQLRVDVSKFNAGIATRDDTTVGHLIPADNPFVGTAQGINQLIYALGLRNPFTFAFDPATGRDYINDVGENTWEEIDQGVAGANYGWSGGNTDGFGQSPPGPGVYHDPLLAYNHTGGPAGGGIAIVGGTFYSPTTDQFPASYVGKYFYADLTGNFIRVFDPANPGTITNPDTSSAFATNLPFGMRDLKVDAAGNLYYLAGTSGVINKISYTASAQAPTITSQPASLTVVQGQSATFSVVATGSALHYQWQHLVGQSWTNVGSDAASFTIAAATDADAGSYRVTVSNNLASVVSSTANLTVLAPLTTPVVTRQPVSQTVKPGGTATFTVSAIGSLPLSYHWQHLVSGSWQNVGVSAPTLTVGPVTSADQGSYRVNVSNNAGTTSSSVVSLVVDTPPHPVIVTPGPADHYNWGQLVSYSGTATDAEDGTIPPSRLFWTVLFVREDRPDGTGLRVSVVQSVAGVASGAFVPAVYDTTPLAWYRVILTAADSVGNTAISFVDVHPNLVRLTFGSSVPGLILYLDGRPLTGVSTFDSVVGLPHAVFAPSPQRIGLTTYQFIAWSDGGAPIHTFITPNSNALLGAGYVPTVPPGAKAAAVVPAQGLKITAASAPTGISSAARWLAAGRPAGRSRPYQ